jgi:hypothetical protein
MNLYSFGWGLIGEDLVFVMAENVEEAAIKAQNWVNEYTKGYSSQHLFNKLGEGTICKDGIAYSRECVD